MTEMAAQTRLAGGAPVALPRVNLLPPEIAERARFRRTQAGLGALVALALLGTGLLFMNSASSVNDAQGGLDAAVAEQAQLAKEKAQFSSVTATYAAAAAADLTLAQAMSQEVRYAAYLHDMALTMPEHVWVTSVAYKQTPTAAGAVGTVTMSGVAYVYPDVAVWLETLAKEKGYEAPTLVTSEAGLIGAIPSVKWTTTTLLSPEALSGRYVKAGS